VRYLVLAAALAAFFVSAGAAAAMPDGSGAQPPPPPSPPVILVITTIPTPTVPPTVLGGGGGTGGSGGGGSSSSSGGGTTTFPSGCRDVDLYASQTSFLFHTRIYRFHQLKHWCWRGGVIYDERHAWSFDGSATACLGVVYPDNSWSFTWWYGKAGSGHYSEERAHVTNCIFHIGDWKEFYPDVKIWAYANGTYKVATSN
jgi:hypothetical protein